MTPGISQVLGSQVWTSSGFELQLRKRTLEALSSWSSRWTTIGGAGTDSPTGPVTVLRQATVVVALSPLGRRRPRQTPRDLSRLRRPSTGHSSVSVLEGPCSPSGRGFPSETRHPQVTREDDRGPGNRSVHGISQTRSRWRMSGTTPPE